MAGDEQRAPGAHEVPPVRQDVRDEEDRLLGSLRRIAVVVILLCILLTSVVDPLGRLFIDPNFHASEVFLGTLVGALVILLGLETIPRLPGRS